MEKMSMEERVKMRLFASLAQILPVGLTFLTSNDESVMMLTSYKNSSSFYCCCLLLLLLRLLFSQMNWPSLTDTVGRLFDHHPNWEFCSMIPSSDNPGVSHDSCFLLHHQHCPASKYFCIDPQILYVPSARTWGGCKCESWNPTRKLHLKNTYRQFLSPCLIDNCM